VLATFVEARRLSPSRNCFQWLTCSSHSKRSSVRPTSPMASAFSDKHETKRSDASIIVEWLANHNPDSVCDGVGYARLESF
jgi:hypothetical protein